MANTLYLLRHGQTALNASNIIQGQQIDAPLNDVGEQQAKLFWNKYKDAEIDLVVYSNLLRTKQTIDRFLTKPLPGLEYAGSREISWGNIEGKVNEGHVFEEYTRVTQAWLAGNFEAKSPNGESVIEVAVRCSTFLDIITKIPQQRVLVCTHGRIIRILVCLLMGWDFTRMDEAPHSNTGLYLLEKIGEVWSIVLANDQSHLTSGNE